MSFPFAVLLFLQADNLSLKSSNPDIIAFAIKITALVMFFEPLRGVFNSVISSYHQFKILFIYQFLISVVSLLIYAPMLYFFAFRGFYFAYFLFSLIATLVLLFIALRNFKGIKINFSTKDFIKYSRELFSISLGIYFVKILYSFWLSGPALYFNYFGGYDEKTIAVFALAILFATKLLIFSDSITDVTLAVNSKKYVEEPELFKIDYKENYIKTSFIIAFFCSVFAFFNFEIIAILNMLTKKDYSLSSYIIPFIVIGVWFYSNIDLLKSSVLVPAKKIVGMVFIHVF